MVNPQSPTRTSTSCTIWRPGPSGVSELPARRLWQLVLPDLVKAVRPGQPDCLRRHNPEDTVRRGAGRRRIRTVDLVALRLERPAVRAQDLRDVSDGARLVQGFRLTLDD